MSDLFENISNEPQSPKGPIQVFFEKWIIVIFCYSLSVALFCVDVKFANRHYPEFSELTHFTGGLEDFSVVDSRNNHKITMKLMTGDTFHFDKVDFIKPIKNNLARGAQIDVWAEGSNDPEIWQIAINDKIIMSREALVNTLKEKNSHPYRASFYLFIAGSVFAIMINSKNKFISKVYYLILLLIALIALAVKLYLLFFAKE